LQAVQRCGQAERCNYIVAQKWGRTLTSAETLIIAAGGLTVFGFGYVWLLTATEVGRALNSAPEIQPFLTAFGLVSVVVAFGALFGGHVAGVLTLMFVAVGAPFLMRGAWRLARNYVGEARARMKAESYAKSFVRRD